MKTQGILILALLSAALAYTLPDLGVNQQNPTCSTVTSLQATAQSDKTRLQNMITNINAAVANLQTILPLLETIRAKNHDLVSLTFLQVNTRSKGRTSFRNAQGAVSSIMNNIQDDPILTSMIDQAMIKISINLNQLSAMSDPSAVNDLVTQTEAAVNDLIDYLNWASNQISTQWIPYINGRITTLANFYTACNTPTYAYTTSTQYGGNGGHAFTADPTSGRDNYYLKQINVRSGDDIDAIQIILTDGSNTITNGWHGGSGGGLKTVTPPSKINQIRIYYDQYVKGIQFFYSGGGDSGVIGHSSGLTVGTINVNGDIVGVAGREGYYIDALAFIIKTRTN